MPAVLRTELTLPADPRLVRLAQDYVRSLAALAGLPEDQAESLAQGLLAACQDHLDRAYEDEEAGTVRLVGEVTPVALTLSVHDQGLPFCEAPEPGEPSPDREGPATACFPGGGLYLLQQCADEVQWINHGMQGNELRLTKYLTGVCFIEAPGKHEGTPHQPVLPGGSPDYLIRLLVTGDAIRVAQLMYRVYGYSYSNEDFYYPERLDHDLETGRHVGVVAVAANGEIAGHVGVERPDLGPLAELGQLAVAPAHRGYGLRKRMGDRLQEEIQRLGLTGLFAEAVTLHTISQEGSESRGLRVTGLKLLDWQARFKRVQTIPGVGQETSDSPPGPQRETMVYYFKYLAPPAQALICAPSRHRRILAQTYENLGIPVKFLEPSGPTGPGRLAVHYDQTTGTGTIQVNHLGLDSLPEILQARRDLIEMAGAAVVGLNLPLAQGGTPFLCEAAEAAGFFFSGVQPYGAAAGDFLRLQYLNVPLDPDRLHLVAPFARELLIYILQERTRVGQPSKI